jgi:hypothetical protein
MLLSDYLVTLCNGFRRIPIAAVTFLITLTKALCEESSEPHGVESWHQGNEGLGFPGSVGMIRIWKDHCPKNSWADRVRGAVLSNFGGGIAEPETRNRKQALLGGENVGVTSG